MFKDVFKAALGLILLIMLGMIVFMGILWITGGRSA